MKKFNIDYIGSAISSVCAVHCLIMPLVLTSLPVISIGFLTDYKLEVLVLIISIVLASISCFNGHKKHGKWRVSTLFIISIVLMCIAHYMHHNKPSYELKLIDNSMHLIVKNTMWNVVVMPVGGICAVIGHILNKKHVDKCTSCECNGHSI